MMINIDIHLLLQHRAEIADTAEQLGLTNVQACWPITVTEGSETLNLIVNGQTPDIIVGVQALQLEKALSQVASNLGIKNVVVYDKAGLQEQMRYQVPLWKQAERALQSALPLGELALDRTLEEQLRERLTRTHAEPRELEGVGAWSAGAGRVTLFGSAIDTAPPSPVSVGRMAASPEAHERSPIPCGSDGGF